MAGRIAERHLAVKRIATQWVEAEANHQTKFDDTVGERKVRNPATGRDIKLKSLKRHEDPKLRQRYKDEYAKWRGTQKDDGGAEGKTKTQSKLKTFLAGIKGASKAMVTAVKSAPEATQKMIVDPAYRREQTKAAAQAIKKSGKAGAKRIWDAMKSESHSVFVETPKILHGLVTDNAKAARDFAKLPKEERTKEKFKEMVRTPTKKEIKTLYGSAVYAGGIALAMAGGPAGAGIAGMATAGASAFAHSFTLHVGIKAVAQLVDDGFLFYEAGETAANTAIQMGVDALAGFVPSSSALYPFSPWSLISKGLGAVKEVGSMVLGAEESDTDPNPDEIMQDFIAKLQDAMADVLAKGISDEDMQKILAENHGLPASAKE